MMADDTTAIAGPGAPRGGHSGAVVASAATATDPPRPKQPGFVRAIGLFPATAINMSQMVGIGPFITIPLLQMAKTVAALECFKERHLPYISILTAPTVGGVPASWLVMLAFIPHSLRLPTRAATTTSFIEWVVRQRLFRRGCIIGYRDE